MAEDDDRLVNAITRLIPTLLTTMEAFEQVQRNMHPPRLTQLAGLIQPYEASLNDALEDFRPLEFPEHLSPFRERVVHAAEYALRACNGVINHESGFGAVMKAMRAQCRAQEIIFPLAPVMSPVSQYFLEPSARENIGLIKQLSEGAEKENAGIMNADNDRKQRGGFTLYVPENAAADEALSLVVALHGGTGHGADFLWSWLREARTRKFLLLAPTSQQDTWSLMGEEHDLPYLLSMLEYVKSRWQVDEDHILLTGMSDGATYSLLAALHAGSPFTHIAPFSGVLHPELTATGRLQYARDRPVYLVHGKLDWMFPIETAWMARQELENAGADLVFREVDDLSHNYARALNPDVLDWFNPALGIPPR